MKKIASFLFLFILSHNTWADDFKFKSKIDSVSKPGFYKIVLSPEIISALNADYSDIRIFDSKHNEVPYIFSQEQRSTERTGFKEYEIIENNYLPKQKITRVVVHNASKTILSVLSLVVRNSEVEKEITLKGSDDQSHWYIIKRNFPVQSTEFNGETSKIMILEFPKSDYEYFELTMNDKKRDPIQVIKIGYYDSEVAKGLYTAIPVPSIKQLDSAKKSYLTLTFDRPYEISNLEVTFNGPELFMRHCYVGNYVSYQKKTTFEEFGHFIAYSKHQPIWEFDKIKTKELVIIIDNLDNPPLKATMVQAYQLNKYLIANLKPNEEYHLFLGKSMLQTPVYDLTYFTDSIPKNISLLKTSKPILLSQVVSKEKFVFFNKSIMWGVIGAIVLLLAWFTIRLARDLGKEKES